MLTYLNNDLRTTKLAIFDLNLEELLKKLCLYQFMFRLTWIVICFIWIKNYVKRLIIKFPEITGHIKDQYPGITNNEKDNSVF